MPENTLNGALRALGFAGDEMMVHGFRTLASTLLNEAGVDPDLIEMQLAHLERDKSRRAYNRAERLAARRKLMQLWGDALDHLRAGAPNAFAATNPERVSLDTRYSTAPLAAHAQPIDAS